MKQQEYKDELLSFAKRQRKDHPLKDAEDLAEDSEEDWQRRVIGGHLISWLDRRVRSISEQRHTMRVFHFDPKPIVVFTTTPPGIAAAKDIMGESPEDFVYLLREEFEHWEEKHRDEFFKFHIHYWGYFNDPSPELHGELAKAYPSAGVDQLRLHRTGDMWGPNCGVFADHLWRWTGESMELLQEAYSKGIY